MCELSDQRVIPRKPGSLHLPKGWLDYSMMGKVVPGTKFLPFKVPLKEEICRRHLDKECWFTPEELLRKAPNLKLIIDLTQTDRFYDSKWFTENGIQYKKIICPGGGHMLPTKHIIATFSRTVSNFMESHYGQDKAALIGVHCTHGLNRTGYLICNYMVGKLGFSAGTAVKLFEEARGYRIHRELFRNHILSKGHAEDNESASSNPSGHRSRISNMPEYKKAPSSLRRNGYNFYASSPLAQSDYAETRTFRKSKRN